MYSITVQNPKENKETLIFSDAYAIETTKLEKAELQLAVNSAGSLSLFVPPQNAAYSKIEHLTTIIRVYREDRNHMMKEIWQGRPLTEDAGFNNVREIFCEGELAFLNDTMQIPRIYSKTQSISDFLEELLGYHNANYVEETYKFHLGRVTVEEDEEVEYRYSDYESTLSCITQNLLNRYGGMLVVRHAMDGNTEKRYLDYLADYEHVNKQTIEFGKNLTDITRSWDMDEFATVLIPLGKQLDSPAIENNVIYKPAGTYRIFVDPETKYYAQTSEIEDIFLDSIPTLVVGDKNYRRPLTFKIENEIGFMGYLNKASDSSAAQFVTLNTVEDFYPRPKEYVTIEEANDGDIRLKNQTAISSYGWFETTHIFDDVEDPELLKELGEDFLSEEQFDGVQIQINAVDMHYLKLSIDAINILDLIKVISKPHGLDKYFPVTELTIPINRPEDSTITLGGNIDGKTNTITSKVATLIGDSDNKPKTKKATLASSDSQS